MVSKQQVLRHRIADWLTEIECLKQLTYHIVRMKLEKYPTLFEVDTPAEMKEAAERIPS